MGRCAARPAVRGGARREGRDSSPRASRRACPTSAGTRCDGRRRLPLQPTSAASFFARCMGSVRFRSVSSPAAVLRGRRSRARWARSAFPSTDLADVLGFNFTGMHQLKACTAQIAQFVHGIRILAICSCGGILQICQWYRVCDAGALRAEPLATLLSCAVIKTSQLGRGPPQAAWRGAVEHPSGGPSAPGRRCWRLGRKRPSPFSNSGPTHSATLRPEFGGP